MYVLDDFTPDVRVLKEAQSLVKMGCIVKIIGTHWDKSFPTNEIFEKNIIVCRENIIRLPLIKYFHFWVKGVIKQLNFPTNIVICHDLNVLPIGWLMGHIKNIKVVYDMHEYWPALIEETKGKIWFWIFTALEKWMIRYPDLLTTTSPNLANFFQTYYKLSSSVGYLYNMPLAKVATIPRKEIPRKENEILFVIVGNIVIGRGVELLPQAATFLKSLREHSDPYIRIIVIGKGNYRNKVERDVRKEGLTDIIQFMGHFPYEEAMALSKSCDVGLSLSQPTSLNMLMTIPNRLFEYFANSLPVLSTDMLSIRNIIKDDKVGWIIPAKDPKILAEKMLYIARNKEEIIEKKARIAKIFPEKYSWESMHKKMIALYSNLLN